MQQRSSLDQTSETHSSQFYSVLRLHADAAVLEHAESAIRKVAAAARLDRDKRGRLCVDLSRERQDWMRHQHEVAMNLEQLSPVLAGFSGLAGFVDSSVNLSCAPGQILEVFSFRITTSVVQALDRLGFEYELSIYLSSS